MFFIFWYTSLPEIHSRATHNSVRQPLYLKKIWDLLLASHMFVACYEKEVEHEIIKDVRLKVLPSGWIKWSEFPDCTCSTVHLSCACYLTSWLGFSWPSDWTLSVLVLQYPSVASRTPHPTLPHCQDTGINNKEMTWIGNVHILIMLLQYYLILLAIQETAHCIITVLHAVQEN